MIAVVVCPYGELVDDALKLHVEDVGGHDAAVVAGHAGGTRRLALARLPRATCALLVSLLPAPLR